MSIFKKYLLSSVALRPEDGAGSGGPADDLPEDERIEVPEDDDETPHDPEEEGDGTEDASAADDEGDEADAAPDGAAAPSRAARSHAELRADRRRLAEENATLTRQIDELRRNPPAPQPMGETPQQRADRLALMAPEDRIREEVRDALGRHEQRNEQLMGTLLDNSDRSSFETLCTTNPLARKLQAEVERRLGDLRSKGGNCPRNAVLTYLIGERVLAQRAKGKTPARGRQANDVRPSRTGSDVEPSRGARRNTGDATADFERRYGDTPI